METIRASSLLSEQPTVALRSMLQKWNSFCAFVCAERSPLTTAAMLKQCFQRSILLLWYWMAIERNRNRARLKVLYAFNGMNVYIESNPYKWRIRRKAQIEWPTCLAIAYFRPIFSHAIASVRRICWHLRSRDLHFQTMIFHGLFRWHFGGGAKKMVSCASKLDKLDHSMRI